MKDLPAEFLDLVKADADQRTVMRVLDAIGFASNRYIYLNDSIIDREKVCVVYRSAEVEGRISVLFVNAVKHSFDGDDAVLLWKAFGAEKDFYKDEV